MNLRLLALAGVATCAVALPLAVASASRPGEDHRTVAPAAGRGAGRAASETEERDGRTAWAGGFGGAGAAGGVGWLAGAGGGVRDGFGGAYGGTYGGGYSGGYGGRAAGDAGAGGGGDAKAPDDRARVRTPDRTPEWNPRWTPAQGWSSAGQSSVGQPTAGTPSGSRSPLDVGIATAARCGPELTSPDGVEAQTCVLTQGADTWARTYHRNATGRALETVLSLMGPKGRTVQVRCAVGAGDDPEVCDTPREPVRGGPDDYTAVAEFAEAGEDGPLLLRVGSNSTAPTGS
ncbi:hypothetical protein ACFQE4_15405 [Streptomyces thermocoprophilus]|uniref:Uncharacterized protein n=1 Tax=Streptomyces thermocoprophilus TaxID=78356 RepID=A0ABV5VJP9_9ACTN